jgi:hypothetical protein
MTGMVILVSTGPLEERTYVPSSNEAVLTSITISVIQMFCPLMKQYSLVLPFLVILVSTATLMDRTYV